MQKTVMVMCPHADDAAAFCGGQVLLFAQAGWQVIMVRVTDDYTDSVGLSIAETIQRNTEEMHIAAKILGVAAIIELNYPTDSLSEISHGELREKIIRLFRQYQPYAVMSFDPYASFEPNRDHVVVARAVEEAFWTATFDKHHPEHLAEGLQPHSVCERWYFARQLPIVNAVIDISSVIDRKIEALCAHKEMIRNTINQTRLQLKTWGRRMAVYDNAVDKGDLFPLVDDFLRAQAADLGKAHDIAYAEVYRVERFGAQEAWIQRESEPLTPDEPLFNRPFFQV